ncbi:MAG TPA: DUF3021 domain-containing protein [Lachnospiraceae bacterium]|nr:DUF3021 domain-containing protein [Lachnospiraceae bacterium]
MDRLIRKLILGIASGCTFMVFDILISIICTDTANININTQDFVRNAIGFMVSGIGGWVPTLIYECDRFSLRMQRIIHMGICFTVNFITALSLGWIRSYDIRTVTIWSLLSIAFGFLYYFCVNSYYRFEARKINERIRKMQQRD